MNQDDIETERIPHIKGGQGRDIDGGGVILIGALCLFLAGCCIIAAACFWKAGAL